MRFNVALLLTSSVFGFGQTAAAPPPDVDQALRARVSTFLQFQKEGNFRKAYDLVAEDSKDYYFGIPKLQSTSFTLNEIQYSADFSTATVKALVTQPIHMVGQLVEVPGVVTSQWKLQKGEWFWFHDPSKDTIQTIIGSFPAPTGGAVAPATPSPLPKDLGPEAVAAAAAKVTPKATIDKQVLMFTLGKEATQEITFRNNNSGQVRVNAGIRGGNGSVTAEPHTSGFLNPQAEFVVKVTYKPDQNRTAQTEVEFEVDPFGSMYLVPVRFVRENSAPKQ